MSNILFYRDPALPFLELKRCLGQKGSYKKHFHEELSIGLIDEGSTRVWCDGRELQVEAGKVICFPPYVPHACTPEALPNWKYKMLFVRPDWVDRLFDEETDLHKPFLLEDHKNRQCRLLLDRCVNAFQSKGTPLEIETSMIRLTQALYGKNDDGMEREHRKLGETERQHLRRVKEYLHEHFAERVTLETLEAVSGISRFHLIHSFKKENHIPPHVYQNLLRINFAKKALCSGRPISDVAVDAGFYDQSHFTRMFAHFVGVTPQKYAVSQ